MIDFPKKISIEDGATPLLRLAFHFMGGASEDPIGRDGMTDLMTRLLLRGTRDLTRLDFEHRIEQLGVNVLASCGQTSFSLGGTLHQRHAETWLELMRSALEIPAFDQEQIERAKREMVAELHALFDEDASLGRYVLHRSLFDGTPYARLILGTPSSLAKIGRQELIAHHQQCCVRERLVIGAAGDLGHPSVEQGVKKLVERLNIGTASHLPAIEFSARPDRLIIVNKPDRSQNQLFSGQILPGAQRISQLPNQFGTLVLGGNFSSRLVQKLRVERGLSYGAFAWLRVDQNTSAMYCHADVEPERIGEGLEVLVNALDELSTHGITEEEFQFGKQHILKGMPFGQETASMEMAQKVRLALLNRPIEDFERRIERVKALKISDVQTAMHSLHKNRNRVFLIVGSYDEAMKSQLKAFESRFEMSVIDGRLDSFE